MKIATWNLNSIKVRLPQLTDWLATSAPDILCLQETKIQDAFFPIEAMTAMGYHALVSGQKTYNGVAIASREPGVDVLTAIPGFSDERKRVLAATIGDLRVVCLYVPNGESVTSGKYQYKLSWLDALTDWLRQELARHPFLAVLGDYNIAPEDRDVHDPSAWAGQVLFSEPERSAFRKLIDLGLTDSFRLFDQVERSYTWWDYRMNAFRRDLGLRIDHILLSRAAADRCTSARIDRAMRSLERPSDHAPVIVELALPQSEVVV